MTARSDLLSAQSLKSASGNIKRKLQLQITIFGLSLPDQTFQCGPGCSIDVSASTLGVSDEKIFSPVSDPTHSPRCFTSIGPEICSTTIIVLSSFVAN